MVQWAVLLIQVQMIPSLNLGLEFAYPEGPWVLSVATRPLICPRPLPHIFLVIIH